MSLLYNVAPWNDKEFLGSDDTKTLIYTKLKERGFDIEAAKTQPSKGMMIFVKETLDYLDEHKWVVLLSNSPSALDTVSNLVPVIFALNTRKSVAAVTNNLLYSLFSGEAIEGFKHPTDYLKELSRSTLIVHKNAADGDFRMSAFKGRMLEFLDYRRRTLNRYLITGLFVGRMNDGVRVAFFDTLKKEFGTTMLAYIEEKAFYTYYEDKASVYTKKSWKSIRREA